MKQWSRTKLTRELKQKLPEIKFRRSEDVLEKKGGIWASWDTAKFYKGFPVFDLESEKYGNVPISKYQTTPQFLEKMEIRTLYISGVNREIHNWIGDNGWYPQWWDRVNLFFWKYNLTSFGR